MGDKLPTREEFLAYLANRPDLTPTDAAREFGVPERTARRWVAADKKEAAERARRNKAQKANTSPSSPAAKRARARPKIEVADLSGEARGLLIDALELRLRHLASKESLEDGKAAQAHAIALGILIDKCPDLLKFVGAPEGAEVDSAESADRLRRAFGLEGGEAE